MSLRGAKATKQSSMISRRHNWIASLTLAMTKRDLRNALNALDHVLVFRAVFVPDRFDRVLERRLVRYLDDLPAGGLGFFQRLLLVLIPVFAFFQLGFAGEFLDQVLVVGRQRVPDPFREHEHFGND